MEDSIPIPSSDLAARVRQERMSRGWDTVELERRSGVGRTTLYHLEKGRTNRVRSSTVGALAKAFGIPVDELVRPIVRNEAARAAAFDRITNPAIADVVRERPEVFEGWSADDWDELHSQFGVGGQLTPLGALKAAEAINEKRETVRQLQVVLDTHLRDVAREVIETFYRMVQANPATIASQGVMRAMAERLRESSPPPADPAQGNRLPS
jgi:transcriptional regulator with XRE-family HTH domain